MTHSIGDKVFVDPSGELRGVEQGGRRAMYVELVREILELLGYPKNIEEFPLKRALFLAQNQPRHVLFNLNRTPEREDLFKWVGPIHATASYFFENDTRRTGIKGIEDAKGVGKICVLRSNAHNRFLAERGFENLVMADSYDGCIKMLLLGRVDLAPLSTLSSANADEQRTLRNTGVLMMESQGYIALSKDIPDAEVQRWQAAFDRIVASGRYAAISAKYLEATP
ncbi:MAG: transporter substrate-binding domain-containing protein [Deferrisomatales bacterium]|nr:transporter substrate-binding domain-containing protein [Deferrisomatales bacterium]